MKKLFFILALGFTHLTFRSIRETEAGAGDKKNHVPLRPAAAFTEANGKPLTNFLRAIFPHKEGPCKVSQASLNPIKRFRGSIGFGLGAAVTALSMTLLSTRDPYLEKTKTQK